MENITIKDLVTASAGVLRYGCEEDEILSISIDSRQTGAKSLFVPLIGEKSDAHDYIAQAVENGAAAVFSSRRFEPGEWEFPNTALIEVTDTKKALQSFGSYCRKRFAIPFVGVTGSVGKTSTREMVAAALTAGFSVFRTAGNHNSQVGVPITISRITKADQIAVLELGMSEPGELEVIARIAACDLALITNIGVAHIEQLGSQEAICAEKMKIQEGMPAGATLLLNGDDPILKTRQAKSGLRTIYYGIGENCTYRAENIRFEKGYPVFTARYGAEAAEVRLQVFGLHNISNAMAALAVARENGISLAAAAKALEAYRGFQGRQQIHEHNGITVIDDSYNASPDSMKAAISVIDQIEAAGRKIAVLADMLELGDDSAKFHDEIGRYLAATGVEVLLCKGTRAEGIIKGALAARPGLAIRSFSENEELIKYLRTIVKKDDVVLVKGSNSMRLSEVTEALLK